MGDAWTMWTTPLPIHFTTFPVIYLSIKYEIPI